MVVLVVVIELGDSVVLVVFVIVWIWDDGWNYGMVD